MPARARLAFSALVVVLAGVAFAGSAPWEAVARPLVPVPAAAPAPLPAQAPARVNANAHAHVPTRPSAPVLELEGLEYLDFHKGDGSRTLLPSGCDEFRDPRTRNRTVLRFPDTDYRDARVTVDGNSVIVVVEGTRERVTTAFFRVRGEDCFEGVRAILFADGRTVDDAGDVRVNLVGGPRRDVLRGGDDHETLQGFEGDDDLYGYDGDDRLEGGEGDDDLMGDLGDDTYVFEGAFGADVVEDRDEAPGHDVAEFTDLGVRDVLFFRDGEDLLVERRRDARDRVRFRWWFRSPAGSRYDYRIETLRFLDADLDPREVRDLAR